MDAAQLAANVKRHLLSTPGVKAVQDVNPELLAHKLPVMPRAAFQVETDPHQTFIVWVF